MKIPFYFLFGYFTITSARVTYYSKDCLFFNGDILISSEYKDALGAAKTSSYNIPAGANYTAVCKDNFLSKKRARLEIVFNQDKLTLEFEAPAVSGNTISLVSANYAYTQDRQRFPGVLKESPYSASQTFATGEFPIGIWKKTYTCADITILVGNVSIELTNMDLSLFKTEDLKEKVPCPEKETVMNAKQTAGSLKPITFADSCINGSMEIVITGKYADTKGLSKNFEFFIPSTATTQSVCEDRILTSKKASLKIRYQSDNLELKFSAPAVYGDTISLVAINFTIVLDKSKFSDIANSKTETIFREFSNGDYPIGEWNKRNKCSSILLNMGGGLKVELRNIRWAIFRADKARGENECPAPLFVPRARKL